MIKRLSLSVVLLFSLSFLGAQSLEELKKLQKAYEEAQKQKQAEQVIKASLKGEEEKRGELPTEILIRTKEIQGYYQQRLNKIRDELEELEEISGLIDTTKKLKYFGYDFFFNRDSIAFWQNLPMPSTYQLGAGDEIVISLWGETEQRAQSIISRDGTIFIEDVGLLYLGGKSLGAAKNYIRRRYEQVYATLKGKKPTTFIDVTLGQLKGLNVQFTGQVLLPGVHSIHPFSTIITGLIQAGGVDTTGSLREITLIRDNQTVQVFDLYTFLNRGLVEGDLLLQDQDVLFVPLRSSTVSIDGAVLRPARYESRSDETLLDLVNLAHVRSSAQTNIILSRIIPAEDRQNDDYPYQSFILPIKSLNTIIPFDGDSLFLPWISKNDKTVEIFGPVRRPGSYTLVDSMRLLDLLILAGGFQDSTFLKSMQKQIELVRKDGRNLHGKIIRIDVGALLNGDKKQNLLLHHLDQITVFGNPYYEPTGIVEINGLVAAPGIYSLVNEKETLKTMISRAGGLLPEAYNDGIEIFRDTLRVAWHDLTVGLANGDSVYVPSPPGAVLVQGAVHKPRYIAFKKGRSIKEYVNLAGGPTAYADKQEIIVVYPNGEVQPSGRFVNPAVKDGSTIIVNEKSLITEKSALDAFQQLSSIIGSLATLLIMLKTLGI